MGRIRSEKSGIFKVKRAIESCFDTNFCKPKSGCEKTVASFEII